MPDHNSFKTAKNTFIVSDIHLTTAEPVSPRDKLWKRFKQKDFFIDHAFEIFLKKIEEESEGDAVELILAGDIFDFDGVNQLPDKQRFTISWLERLRGLNTEERKSRFKMRKIIEDHPVFFRALGKFISRKNRVIFIIGNHDLELHWPGVQKTVLRALDLTEKEEEYVRFNNFFYISNSDTLIEHGNQHDSHSNCQNPINPKIRGLRKERIRLPFGCFANRYMINGMGYFNPHSDRSYIMTARQYLGFLFSHLLRKEPLLLWTWFWGAIMTLVMTLKEGFSLEVKDPLAVEDQVEEIARNANSTPRMVRELKEIHAPASFMDPLGVARELWLDRAFLVMFAFGAGFWLLSVLNIVWKVSYWWVFLLGLFFLVPFFIFYFRSIKSKIIVDVKYYEKAVKLGSKVTRVKRVIFGHTHEFVHTNFSGIEYLNSGTWSPQFDDVECTKPSCPKTFVWIRPSDADKDVRVANVYEWKASAMTLLC
ncbi:MAG: metallophosphoesterase [Deltaproteobacteria bacterium]|nr:metallophosphoesterase [Deltaproteobacteria bacterium]